MNITIDVSSDDNGFEVVLVFNNEPKQNVQKQQMIKLLILLLNLKTELCLNHSLM